jgi:lipopolysaccharide biosynthesis protein
MLSWDNTARKQDNSHIFHGFSLTLYQQWLNNSCNKTLYDPKLSSSEKLVFINAWNEWAEGTHLEPDRLYGFGYLDVTRRCLDNYASKVLEGSNIILKRESKQSVIIHAHYLDLWDSYKDLWHLLKELKFDTYITVTSLNEEIKRKILATIPQAHLTLVENRGRDILPFIETSRKIKSIGYESICKIHLKKSLYRKDGSELGDRLIRKLLGTKEIIKRCVEEFESDPRLGLLLGPKSALEFSHKNML